MKEGSLMEALLADDLDPAPLLLYIENNINNLEAELKQIKSYSNYA